MRDKCSIRVAKTEESAKLCESFGILPSAPTLFVGPVDAEQVWRDLMAQVLDCGGEPYAFFQLEGHIRL